MKLTVNIASPPDRENLVAEVFVDDFQLAEISEEGIERCVEIYPHPRGGSWQLGLRELWEALERASSRLDAMSEAVQSEQR